MQTHTLIQNSPEWHAHRATHDNASDAPAMMGCSPYTTRSELMRQRATGISKEVDAATQRRFDDGHRFEALARPLAEEIVGEDLYPVVGSLGTLSASFDGLTLMNDIAFEHKSLNDELRAVIVDEACGALLPLHYRVQMEQQLLVSGGEKCLFMATKWQGETLAEQRWTWYYADEVLRAQIVAGWDQFHADLAAYVPADVVEPAPVGKAPESLPALRIEVTGAVTASNLAEFKQTALTAIRSVNRDLKTDADFADAEKAVKWCGDVESRLKAAKEHALSQTADIDALFKALDDIGTEARAVRLDLDKVIARRKVEVKEHAIATARRALDDHVCALNAELAPMRLQPIAADFAAAIKGLRSIASMQDALDTALANGKIAADAQARVIRANLAALKAQAAGLEFLFSDLSVIVHKAADDFATLVTARVEKHKADEARRMEQERERIRAEEADRLAREAAQAKAEAERKEREAQEAAARAEQMARLEREREAEEKAQREQAEARERQAQIDAQMRTLDAAEDAAIVAAPAPVASAPAATVRPIHPAAQSFRNEQPTLKLGEIQSRLKPVSITADGLATLGFEPAGKQGAATLYRESDWLAICQAISAHVLARTAEAVAA
jgi:putative phage-type endonuclease